MVIVVQRRTGAGPMTYVIFAPTGYSNLLPEQKGAICNGMGAADSLLSSFIPNTMYGLDVEEAGNIHDYMYHVGKTIEDKLIADRVFLNNMLRIINECGGWLGPLRRRRAMKYYEAVHYFGGPAFWSDKSDKMSKASGG
jgi:hypothetical protein